MAYRPLKLIINTCGYLNPHRPTTRRSVSIGSIILLTGNRKWIPGDPYWCECLIDGGMVWLSSHVIFDYADPVGD